MRSEDKTRYTNNKDKYVLPACHGRLQGGKGGGGLKGQMPPPRLSKKEIKRRRKKWKNLRNGEKRGKRRKFKYLP